MNTFNILSLLIHEHVLIYLGLLPSLQFFFKIFLMWTIFKVFTEFLKMVLLFNVLVFMTLRHVGSWLPDQESNLPPLH